MEELGGILLSTGERVFGGLVNSFRKVPDEKKKKYLAIAFGLILAIEIGVYVGFSWQGEGREIPFSSASIDLGDFKPRARKAPVIEVDEVFGNQFVKEKKEASTLPANEAGGSVDGEGVVDLDVDGTGSGGNAPNIARCAVRNFPAEAKAYVEEAQVPIQITVDKTGIVREAKPLHVAFKKELPPELKARMRSLFLNAARASLLGRRCPVYSVGGSPVPYKLEVPLSYELYN
ncbi:MAG: hypothetical protein J0L53_12040 [Spirochaetes bacterium]|nr:hypothetical protein [Spirochaetota bacterium]